MSKLTYNAHNRLSPGPQFEPRAWKLNPFRVFAGSRDRMVAEMEAEELRRHAEQRAATEDRERRQSALEQCKAAGSVEKWYASLPVGVREAWLDLRDHLLQCEKAQAEQDAWFKRHNAGRSARVPGSGHRPKAPVKLAAAGHWRREGTGSREG